MKKLILTAAAVFFGLAFTGVLAASQQDLLNTAVTFLHKTAPVLKSGQWVQDENGCIYSVTQKGDRLSLDPAVAARDGKIICR